MNETIAIPADYQYPLNIADEIGLKGKELALAKKYLCNSAVLLPTYDPDEGKEVKAGLKLKALLPKAKILGTVGGGRQGEVIAYKFPKGIVAICDESEYEDPYFLLKPTKSINESFDYKNIRKQKFVILRKTGKQYEFLTKSNSWSKNFTDANVVTDEMADDILNSGPKPLSETGAFEVPANPLEWAGWKTSYIETGIFMERMI